jgi:hypothetical protein
MLPTNVKKWHQPDFRRSPIPENLALAIKLQKCTQLMGLSSKRRGRSLQARLKHQHSHQHPPGEDRLFHLKHTPSLEHCLSPVTLQKTVPPSRSAANRCSVGFPGWLSTRLHI